jgi:hypothetical protein
MVFMKKYLYAILFISILLFVNCLSAGDWMLDDFESGGKNWYFPSGTQTARIESSGDEHGNVLLMIADNSNLAVSSPIIKLGQELSTTESYELFYEVKLNSITAGKLSVSLVFSDVNNKFIKQYFIKNFEENQTTAGWQFYNTVFGNNTEMPFPEGASTLQIRFSFWNTNGISSGQAMFDHIRIISSSTYNRIARDTVKNTDAEIIEPRFEINNEHHYYWIEAEKLAPADAFYGSFKYRHAWSKVKNSMQNESGDCALIRPMMRTQAQATAAFRTGRSGYYNMWLRAKSTKSTVPAGITCDWNGRMFDIHIPSTEANYSENYSWIKVNPTAVKIKRTKTNIVKFSNNLNPAQNLLIDAFLVTDDLNYVPPEKLPPHQYFSVLPYSGNSICATFWHPARLNTSLYICRDSSQNFLMQLRNMCSTPLNNFAIEITLPEGITIDNPINSTFPANYAGLNGVFTSSIPNEFNEQKVSIENRIYNRYILKYKKDIQPYDLENNLRSLFFLVLNADKKIVEGSYQVAIKVLGDKITPGNYIQNIEIIPELEAAKPRLYEWGVDAIYSPLLNITSQKKIMQSFERAGVTVWAERITAGDPILSAKNREQWKMLVGSKNMRLVNWGDWWWPGCYNNESSRDYLRRHPDAIGAWRNDEIGNALAGKLLCPQYLIQGSGESYIREHLEKMVAELLDNGAREYIENLECSNPESFCFCPNCKQEFSEFSGIPIQLIKDLNADRLLLLHKNKWTEFRCRQNAKIVDKITTMARQINPEITIRVFGDLPNSIAKTRFGTDWQRLLKIKNIEGIYAGGNTYLAEHLAELSEMCRQERKSLVTLVKSTLGMPFGNNDLGLRNQAYLEAKIIHDIMCGSNGVYIWWWGTLDGRCLTAIANASKIGEEFGDIILGGQRTIKKIGVTSEFVLITVANNRGKLVALVNPSLYSEDMILEPAQVLGVFPEKTEITNLITRKIEKNDTIRARVDGVFRQGDFAIWYIPCVK